MTPRVSVLLPLWKPDPKYLRQAIESVRGQTFDEWELVAIEDDADGTAAALLESFGDRRIRHVARASRTSLPDALNDGMARCLAPYVARLDSDDVCAPERLARQFEHLEAQPHIAVTGSRISVIDDHGRVIGRRALPVAADAVAAAMRRYNCIAHPAVMFRKSVVMEAGGYGQVSPEDYDLWCRLLVAGHRLDNLPEELLCYRFHEKALKFSAVHDVVRATIATKMRYFRGRLTLGDRARIAAERMLLLLPPRAILRLFRAVSY